MVQTPPLGDTAAKSAESTCTTAGVVAGKLSSFRSWSSSLPVPSLVYKRIEFA